MNNFPNYKFFSAYIQLIPDVLKVRRKTDSFLDWLGDWGGLYGSLHFLAEIVFSPLSAYMLNSKLVELLIKLLPSESKQEKGMSKEEAFIAKYADQPNDPRRKNILTNMISYFTRMQNVDIPSYLASFIKRCRSPKRHKLLEKSVTKIEK